MQKSCCNAYEVAFPIILSAFTNILQTYAGKYKFGICPLFVKHFMDVSIIVREH